MTRSKGSKTHSPCFPGTNNGSGLVNACMLSHISPARLFATPWTIARQAPLSIGCSRQEYWSRLSFPSPGDIPDPGIESGSSRIAGRFFTIWAILVSVQFSRSVMSDSLQPRGVQQARLPCPTWTPRACSNSCLMSQWCHPTISSSVIPFSSCLQSFPESGCFLMSQFFSSGGQSIGASASASVLPVNIQDWFPLELTGLISLQSKGLSRVF